MIDYSKFQSSLKRLEEQYENYRRLDTSLLDLTQDAIAESVVQRFKTCYGCLKKAQACLALMPVSSMARSRPPSGQTRSAAQRTTASRSSRPRLLDLQRLKLYYDGRHTNDAESIDVILLKTLSKTHGEIDETVPIDGRIATAIAGARDEVAEIVDKPGDDRLRLALVAAIAEDHLASRRQSATEGRRERDLRSVG